MISKESKRQRRRKEPRFPAEVILNQSIASHVRDPIQDQQNCPTTLTLQLITECEPAKPTAIQLTHRHVNNDKGLLF